MVQVKFEDIRVSEDVLEVFGANRKEIIEQSADKFKEFIKGTNEHLARLKTPEDMNLFIINAKTNVNEIVGKRDATVSAFKLERCLTSLDQVPEWQEFLQAYTEDRALTLTRVLTAHRPISSEVRRVTEASLSAIGYFQEFIYSTNATAASGADAILDDISIGLYERAIEIVEAELTKVLLKDK